MVKVKVKPEKRQQFLDVIEDDSICSVRDEPGCVRFDVLQDNDDPNTYYFYEVYHDEAAVAAHRQTPHLAPWSPGRRRLRPQRGRRVSCRSWSGFGKDVLDDQALQLGDRGLLRYQQSE
jgi:quinol monooxygenase YgiN